MAQYLKQSTASQEILLGPFVDDTDGKTAETALTIANTDIKVWKTGATTLANKNSGGATHISNGNYYAVLNATDTDTLGPLEVIVQVSGALPVRREYQVLPAWMYDSLFIANGPAPAFGIIDIGTAQSATGTTLVLRSGITVTDDVMIGATLYVYSSTNGLHERRIITDWVSSTDTATVDTWTQTPTGTILYVVYATPPASSVAITADVTKWSGTAVATPDTAGYPKVTIKDGTGAGEIALTSGAIDTVTAITNTVNANVTQISGDSVAADNAESFFDGTGYKDPDNVYIIRSNTAQAGAAGTITLDASASASNDFYNNTFIQIIGGTGAGQARFISDYDGTTKVASVNANWITTPDNTSVFVIWPFGSIPGATAPTAADIWSYATRILTAATNITSTGAAVPITAGGLVSSDVTAISTDTTAADNLESYTDGTIPIPANMTQISGDATAADNLESYTDGTDRIHVDVKEVNSTPLTGDGNATPWGPA